LAVAGAALVHWARDGEESAANERLPVPDAPAAVVRPSRAHAKPPEAAKETVLPSDLPRDFEAEARSGSLSAQSQLCSQSVSEDDAAATYWCEIAARGGDANAQFLYAGLVDLGQGVAVDHEQATQWYEKAAAQEHTQALYVLGKRYLNDDRDMSRGLVLLRQAAIRGHSGAIALLRERGESQGKTFGPPIR
jgi:TPR repeat protein